jgi:hypothetical protein
MLFETVPIDSFASTPHFPVKSNCRFKSFKLLLKEVEEEEISKGEVRSNSSTQKNEKNDRISHRKYSSPKRVLSPKKKRNLNELISPRRETSFCSRQIGETEQTRVCSKVISPRNSAELEEVSNHIHNRDYRFHKKRPEEKELEMKAKNKSENTNEESKEIIPPLNHLLVMGQRQDRRRRRQKSLFETRSVLCDSRKFVSEII